jgi:hypothetical protein
MQPKTIDAARPGGIVYFFAAGMRLKQEVDLLSE